MYELLPIILGALTGALTAGVDRTVLRWGVRMAAALAAGCAAVLLSGEEAPLLVWDTAQALAAAGLAGALVARMASSRRDAS